MLAAHPPGATGTVSAAILGGPGQDQSPRKGKQNRELEKDSLAITLGAFINAQKYLFFSETTQTLPL